jgi:hypothetical protein
MQSRCTGSPRLTGGLPLSVFADEAPCRGIEDKLSAQMRRRRPTDDAAAENVENDGEKQ